jgi:hypothetical protein
MVRDLALLSLHGSLLERTDLSSWHRVAMRM